MPVYNVVNSSRRTNDGRGLFILGSRAEANAAAAGAIEEAGIPKSRVLNVHVPHDCTCRMLVHSICKAAGQEHERLITLARMTERCLQVIQQKRILVIDGLHTSTDVARSRSELQAIDNFLRCLLNWGISIIANGPCSMRNFNWSQQLIRRFRFVPAQEITPAEAVYLISRK